MNNKGADQTTRMHRLICTFVCLHMAKTGYFPFGFEGRIWDLIVSVPDHCLSFSFSHALAHKEEECSKNPKNWDT